MSQEMGFCAALYLLVYNVRADDGVANLEAKSVCGISAIVAKIGNGNTHIGKTQSARPSNATPYRQRVPTGADQERI